MSDESLQKRITFANSFNDFEFDLQEYLDKDQQLCKRESK
jgi:hypothetical protein